MKVKMLQHSRWTMAANIDLLWLPDNLPELFQRSFAVLLARQPLSLAQLPDTSGACSHVARYNASCYH